MATVAEYRKWAEECFEWARAASDEGVREQYASLAEFGLSVLHRLSSAGRSISPSQRQRRK
jgi:hypothetical protein